MHNTVPLVQINDGELKETKAEEPTALGDLQPGRTVTVNILMTSLFVVDSIRGIRRTFSISADELGRVAYQYPLPGHIKDRRLNRFIMAMLWLSLCVTILAAISKPLAHWLGFEF